MKLRIQPIESSVVTFQTRFYFLEARIDLLEARIDLLEPPINLREPPGDCLQRVVDARELAGDHAGHVVEVVAYFRVHGRTIMSPQRDRHGRMGRAQDVGTAAVALDRSDSVEFRDLRQLEAVLKGKRIVLLGENGHGVGDFTVHKARIVRFLHERLGFDVIAFESPFDDCARANAAIETLGAVRAAQSCLLVQLQHAEIRPLFDYMRASRATGKPLAFAGLDLQISLFSARARPAAIRTQLGARNPRLASELAVGCVDGQDGALARGFDGQSAENRRMAAQRSRSFRPLGDALRASTVHR
jgi:erythromycin esterase-like protein